jgi:hypothetical protein
MTHRAALTVILLTLLGLAACAHTERIQVSDVKMLAGNWEGKAVIRATSLPTALSVKEDGSYSGHVGGRPVQGVIRTVAGQGTFVGGELKGTVGLYESSSGKRFLRAWADTGEVFDYEERK